jgi:hypothetical protein
MRSVAPVLLVGVLGLVGAVPPSHSSKAIVSNEGKDSPTRIHCRQDVLTKLAAGTPWDPTTQALGFSGGPPQSSAPPLLQLVGMSWWDLTAIAKPRSATPVALHVDDRVGYLQVAVLEVEGLSPRPDCAPPEPYATILVTEGQKKRTQKTSTAAPDVLVENWQETYMFEKASAEAEVTITLWDVPSEATATRLGKGVICVTHCRSGFPALHILPLLPKGKMVRETPHHIARPPRTPRAPAPHRTPRSAAVHTAAASRTHARSSSGSGCARP